MGVSAELDAGFYMMPERSSQVERIARKIARKSAESKILSEARAAFPGQKLQLATKLKPGLPERAVAFCQKPNPSDVQAMTGELGNDGAHFLPVIESMAQEVTTADDIKAKAVSAAKTCLTEFLSSNPELQLRLLSADLVNSLARPTGYPNQATPQTYGFNILSQFLNSGDLEVGDINACWSMLGFDDGKPHLRNVQGHDMHQLFDNFLDLMVLVGDDNAKKVLRDLQKELDFEAEGESDADKLGKHLSKVREHVFYMEFPEPESAFGALKKSIEEYNKAVKKAQPKKFWANIIRRKRSYELMGSADKVTMVEVLQDAGKLHMVLQHGGDQAKSLAFKDKKGQDQMKILFKNAVTKYATRNKKANQLITGLPSDQIIAAAPPAQKTEQAQTQSQSQPQDLVGMLANQIQGPARNSSSDTTKKRPRRPPRPTEEELSPGLAKEHPPRPKYPGKEQQSSSSSATRAGPSAG